MHQLMTMRRPLCSRPSLLVYLFQVVVLVVFIVLLKHYLDNRPATLGEYLQRKQAFDAAFSNQFPNSWRNFDRYPVRIGGVADLLDETLFQPCSVPCLLLPAFMKPDVANDASFEGEKEHNLTGLTIRRSMESPAIYTIYELETAKASYDIVMTTSLASDVPVPYFSWLLQEFMKPPKAKTSRALSSAFISNCGAKNFRLEAVKALQTYNNKHRRGGVFRLVDFFGECASLEKVREKKEDVIGNYKFHLAFENSNEIDYVTEKFFQSLVEGTVPIVIGAPNIHDFEPAENSILELKRLDEVPAMAQKMMQLAGDDDAYWKMLDWKLTGPSDKFKALIDLSLVHSTCRLCIHVADKIRRDEDKKFKFKCHQKKSSSSVRHFFIRERGRFEYVDAFFKLDADDKVKALMDAAFDALTFSAPDTVYMPLWTQQRDKNGRHPPENAKNFYNDHPPEIRFHRIYETGKTQREVLYGIGAALDSSDKIAKIFKNDDNENCIYLEAILV